MPQHSLVFLQAGEADALDRLDRVFAQWGLADGAERVIGAPLLPVSDLATLDYYQNFPHQALVVSPLDVAQRPFGADVAPLAGFTPAHLEPAEFALPSAACYAVYLGLGGSTLTTNMRVTLVGRCFRREDHYAGLRRLLGFHMREVVALGTQEFVEEHIEHYSRRILAFAEALGLSLRKEAACDPFFDASGPRAKLQMLAPVKYEFLAGDLAVSSVNKHRTFFGERCSIRLADQDQPVFTSCAAFGLERWISVLHERHGSWTAVQEAIEKALIEANQPVERT